MSKKSRRRNKKILAALALAGGAAMLARGRGKGIGTKETISDAQKAHNFASDAAVTDVVNPNLKKVVAPISKNIFRTRHRVTDSAGNTIPSTNKMANIAAMNAPKGIYPPGSVPMPLRAGNLRGMNRAKGGRIGAKSGGRVTGIAKRGFGRALMKGKK